MELILHIIMLFISYKAAKTKSSMDHLRKEQ